MRGFSLVEKIAEKKTGLTVEDIRDYTPGRFRRYLEKRGGSLVFRSFFPFIGRGNVLRDALVSSEEINSEIDAILR